MAESATHRRVKSKAAGAGGRTEVRISRGRRLDAVTSSKAVEVETSGRTSRLEQAARRLKASSRRTHVLVVPQRDMRTACKAMRSVGTCGTVRNLSGTRRSSVRVNSTSGKSAGDRKTSKRR